ERDVVTHSQDNATLLREDLTMSDWARRIRRIFKEEDRAVLQQVQVLVQVRALTDSQANVSAVGVGQDQVQRGVGLSDEDAQVGLQSNVARRGDMNPRVGQHAQRAAEGIDFEVVRSIGIANAAAAGVQVDVIAQDI